MWIPIDYRKTGVLIIFTLYVAAGYSQTTINNYKYVLLPPKFEFLPGANEYGLNSTAKSLLEQKGFTVFWTNGDLPQDLGANKCNALVAQVTERKAFLTTNLTLTLTDCFGNVIYKGKEGKSREKEYDAAYKEALTAAFASLNAVPYKYDSTLTTQPPQSTNTAAATTPTASTSAPAATSPAAPVPVAPAPATTTQTTTTAPAMTTPATLYAQATPTGYQLIDTTPKKVMTLLRTSLQDCYLVDSTSGTSNGIVFKTNGQWLYEYYKDGALVSQKLAIKF